MGDLHGSIGFARQKFGWGAAVRPSTSQLPQSSNEMQPDATWGERV